MQSSPSMQPPPSSPSRTSHRWLLVIPFAWQVGLAPFVNDVSLRPLSLPFPMAWQMAGIVLTTIVIAIVYRIDRHLAQGAEPDADPDLRD